MDALMPVISDIVDAISSAYKSSGWLAGLAALLMLSVRTYRLEIIQALLPPQMRWAAWSTKTQWALMFGTAAAGVAITGVLGHLTAAKIVVGALVAGFGAIGAHKGTQAVGAQLPEAVTHGIDPGLLRRTSVRLLLDKDRVPPQVKP